MTENEDLGDYIEKYEMWYTAGQERYKSLTKNYYRKVL